VIHLLYLFRVRILVSQLHSFLYEVFQSFYSVAQTPYVVAPQRLSLGNGLRRRYSCGPDYHRPCLGFSYWLNIVKDLFLRFLGGLKMSGNWRKAAFTWLRFYRYRWIG
jgi:hypothetical protein